MSRDSYSTPKIARFPFISAPGLPFHWKARRHRKSATGFRVWPSFTIFMALEPQKGIAPLMDGCYAISDYSVAFPRASPGIRHPYLRAVIRSNCCLKRAARTSVIRRIPIQDVAPDPNVRSEYARSDAKRRRGHGFCNGRSIPPLKRVESQRA